MECPKCKNCGREFIPKTTWQKFCDNPCRVAWHIAARKRKTQKYMDNLPIEIILTNDEKNA
jgi:hypothetical protein